MSTKSSDCQSSVAEFGRQVVPNSNMTGPDITWN